MDVHEMFGPIYQNVSANMPKRMARIDSKVCMAAVNPASEAVNAVTCHHHNRFSPMRLKAMHSGQAALSAIEQDDVVQLQCTLSVMA